MNSPCPYVFYREFPCLCLNFRASRQFPPIYDKTSIFALWSDEGARDVLCPPIHSGSPTGPPRSEGRPKVVRHEVYRPLIGGKVDNAPCTKIGAFLGFENQLDRNPSRFSRSFAHGNCTDACTVLTCISASHLYRYYLKPEAHSCTRSK